ncbi:MAG: hypothetical protein JWN45_2233 [Acidobacteriaceae bacterium]|nr:hypothetical protein [Acidobacteriaceae bacterium]
MIAVIQSKREFMSSPDTLPQNLSHLWSNMTVDRYAQFAKTMGSKVVKQNDVWWKRGHLFCYKPLLPFKKYDIGKVGEAFSKFDVCQYGVHPGQAHNSYLNFIVFEDLCQYEIRKMRKSSQRNLKTAMNKDVVVRRLVDEKEFCAKAYNVYLSFYQRSKYGFRADRTQKSGFVRWSSALFQFPELVVLGAFSGQKLVSFEIGCLLDNTIVLNTSVHSDIGLRLRAPDLLLHYWRLSARESGRIRAIYDGALADRPGVNEFKIHRGGRAVALPAFLQINPVLLWLIRKMSASLYKRLRGLGPDEIASTRRSQNANNDCGKSLD